ncbi:MAG: UDP-N-acetylglucosamine 1-carboxyvinyltransferase [Mycoplasmatota bacterium]|nr:UDP-N-acetylglucosamine 1-carboxyvinyltransferase [Mycoplasmatota bacterium]
MPKIKIEGGHKLTGSISVSGAKNSAVALIPASILCDETVTINNIPDITDVDDLEKILTHLNAKINREKGKVEINSSNIVNKEITQELSKKLRASYYFMGALLGKFKKVDMYFPGGCAIGARPINLHLKGFELLGAKITEEDNHFIIEADKLRGNNIYLDFPSVGATINIMLAAVKARGKTVIDNAAQEPEIANIATFLNNMGAKIKGAGTSTITIIGVKYLHSCFHEVIPDRIEAGTYLIIGALLGKKLKIDNMIPSHLEALIAKLTECGVNMEIGLDNIIINDTNEYLSTNIKTLVYPGFATDLQQIMATFLTQCHGRSVIEETIYENRFQNLKELDRMGANTKVRKDNRKAVIKGKTPLKGTAVTATDLRGGASLLIAGLIAEGTTTIDNISYILRGYDKIIEKLTKVGAKIEII